MAAINDLLKQVQDVVLRSRLEAEFARLSKNKKFGLVFEDHIPECTPLYDISIKCGFSVFRKTDPAFNLFTIIKLSDNTALCRDKITGDMENIPISELVTVAQFGEPIFPVLQPIDFVENAPSSNLWHTLIEADNYHALQLLEYLYPKKVDCIYIDPPYNTGVKDWKYNDAYVDSSDSWNHSKWLSMMKKRLRIAKRILTDNGVLVISISYHELHRLMLLCEELFPDRQVVSVTVQTSSGKPKGGFNFQQEYLLFITSQDFSPHPTSFAGGRVNAPFHNMTLATFTQMQRPNQTYPIFVNPNNGHIVSCGASLATRVKNGAYSGNLSDFEFDYGEAPEGTVALWPVSNKGGKCVWRLIASRLMEDWEKGYIKVIPQKSSRNQNQFSIQYLSAGIIAKIENGEIITKEKDPSSPTVVLDEYTSEGAEIPTIWTEKSFYTARGTGQIQDIFGSKGFPYPKPLDLIVEVLRACTSSDSLVVDFFAGSGTTLHAINLLNTEDEGHRRCIIVTNNEVSESESKILKKATFQPGDSAWEARGICRAVTWPRTKFSIIGKRTDGSVLTGEYTHNTDGEKRLMSEGFPTNVEYFKLGFLDKNAVSLGKQLKEILPLLWLKAGAIGKRPEITDKEPSYLILSQNHFAILIDETKYAEFAEKLKREDRIKVVYFVTNSEDAFREMTGGINLTNTYQLYCDYIDNFVLGSRRDS